MNVAHRTLRRVRLHDAEEASTVFELLMGNEVAPRREFIIDSGQSLERDRIDA
jgi:DNA gyrase subunit B